MVCVIQVCWKLASRSICSCSQAVSKPEWHIPLLCVQWKTPDDGQRNCPKHAEFRSKNKFEILVHLVGFIIRNLSRCTVRGTSNFESISEPNGKSAEINSNCHTDIINTTTSHELNAGYEPASSPARSAVRRQTIKTAWDVGGKELSIFSILWALMISLGLNYIYCVAYTPQRFLDSYATRQGKLVDHCSDWGNSYHCVFVYTRHRATDNDSTVLWALPGRVVAFPHDLPYTVYYATTTNTVHSR